MLVDSYSISLKWITPSEICISSYHTKAEFNNCLIIHSKYLHRQNKPVTENNLVNDIKVTVHQKTSKDRHRADRAKIRTHNNKRNNNFMIFQKSRLKLINNLFENRLIN